MKLEKVSANRLPAISVLLPGGVGAAVVVRTLFVYLGNDALASLIIVAMGAGLAVGLFELFGRQRRALELADEARRLPSSASEEAIDGASPTLRALLRARLEHAPAPAFGESITPYLVGLMVMLGLLGTLLGLFETLRGAGHALTQSGDIDALRGGLSGPLRGLTRSFGCSAAGVSASAMLGLAAVLVRRLEGRALSVVHAYAVGPLRELSPLRRQLAALDRLAVQGDALPRAADALAAASTRLGTLSERWERAQQKASEAQAAAIAEAVERMSGEIARRAGEAGRALSEEISPVLTRVAAQTGEAAARHMGATLEALERDLAARRNADELLRAAFREELTAMRTWIEQETTARAASIADAARELTTQLGVRLDHERALVERSEQAMALIAASGQALNDALARQEQAVRALLEGGAAQLEKMGAVSQEGAREALDKLVAITGQQGERFAALEAEIAASQAVHAAALAEQLGAHVERLGQGLGGTGEIVREAAAVLKASSVEMGAVAELFAKSVAVQRESAEAWLENLGELEGAVERAGRGAAADALGDQLASTQEVFARQLQFQRELFEQLRSLRAPQAAPRAGEHDVSV